MNLEIEWMYPDTEIGPIPVVRLEQVEALIGEAREIIEQHLIICQVLNSALGGTETMLRSEPGYQRAKAFLASPVVAEWRERRNTTAPPPDHSATVDGVEPA